MIDTRDEGPRFTAQTVGEHGELETIPVETDNNTPITQQQDWTIGDWTIGEDSDEDNTEDAEEWREDDEWFEELFSELEQQTVHELIEEIMEAEYTWYPTMTELNRLQHAKNGNPPNIVKDDGMKIYVCTVEPCLIRRHVHLKKVLTGAARRASEKGDKKGKKKKQPVYVSCEEDPNECTSQHGHYGDCKVCTRLATKYSPSHPLLGETVSLDRNESEDKEEVTEEEEVIKKKNKKPSKENIEVPASCTSHHESEVTEDESLSLSVVKTCVKEEDKKKGKKRKTKKEKKVQEKLTPSEKPEESRRQQKPRPETETVLLKKEKEVKHRGKKERKVRGHETETEPTEECEAWGLSDLDSEYDSYEGDEDEEEPLVIQRTVRPKSASVRNIGKTKSKPHIAPAKAQAPRAEKERESGVKLLTQKIDESLKPQVVLPVGVTTYEKQVFLSGQGEVKNSLIYRFASIFFSERKEHAVNMDLNSLQTGSYNDGAVQDTISIFRIWKLVSNSRKVKHELIEAGLTRTLRVHVFKEIAEALLVDATLTGMKIVTADGEAVVSAPGRIQTQAMSLPNGKTLMRDFPDMWVWTMVYTLNQFMLAQLRLQRALPAKKKIELPSFPNARP